jgi:hypothetical protein
VTSAPFGVFLITFASGKDLRLDVVPTIVAEEEAASGGVVLEGCRWFDPQAFRLSLLVDL